jgi:hypothetical protein
LIRHAHTGAPSAERIIPVPGRTAEEAAGVIVAAVDDSPVAAMVAEAAVRIATESGQAVHVVHAREAAVGGDVAVDGEALDDARALVRRHLDHSPRIGFRLTARSCCTQPITERRAGRTLNTGTGSPPALS